MPTCQCHLIQGLKIPRCEDAEDVKHQPCEALTKGRLWAADLAFSLWRATVSGKLVQPSKGLARCNRAQALTP